MVEIKERALSYFVLSVTSNILCRIAAVESAPEAWRELDVLYSEDLLANRHRLKKGRSREKRSLCYACHGRGHYRRNCSMMRSCAGKEQIASIAVDPTADSYTVLACSAD